MKVELNKKEADHLMKFRIKEECNRLQKKVKEDIFRQVNKCKDGWKVKLLFINCNGLSNDECHAIMSEMLEGEIGWGRRYPNQAEKFFSKLY